MNRNQLYRRIISLLVHDKILYHPNETFGYKSYGVKTKQSMVDVFKHEDRYTIIGAKFKHVHVIKYKR